MSAIKAPALYLSQYLQLHDATVFIVVQMKLLSIWNFMMQLCDCGTNEAVPATSWCNCVTVVQMKFNL